jgi:hypothetical protein
MKVTCLNEEAGDFKQSAGGDDRFLKILRNY